MRNAALFLGGLTVAAAIASPGFADNTGNSSVTVSGTIVASLEVSSTTLVMPHIVRPAALEPNASVTLVCDATTNALNTVTYTNKSNPFANGIATNANPQGALSANTSVPGTNSTGTCAVVTVSGEPSYNFIVGVGSVVDPTAVGVDLSAPTCKDQLGNPIGDGSNATLTAGGSLAVRCGATITISALAVGATYTDGSFLFTVTYD